MFDVNDFDETLPGPWEWDVKRMAASVMVAARENGFGPPERERAVLGTVESYRLAMGQFASMSNLDVWYAQVDLGGPLRRLGVQANVKAVGHTERALARARTRERSPALTEVVGDEPRIVADPPLIVPLEDLAEGEEREEMAAALHEQLRSYRATLEHDRRTLLEQFRVSDFARKVVGVGSVGMRAWVALMVGRDAGDTLLLQIKQAECSVLERFLPPAGSRAMASAWSWASG